MSETRCASCNRLQDVVTKPSFECSMVECPNRRTITAGPSDRSPLSAEDARWTDHPDYEERDST